jgi:signal transduction histidine kinase/CheY-like chemotaxis protein
MKPVSKFQEPRSPTVSRILKDVSVPSVAIQANGPSAELSSVGGEQLSQKADIIDLAKKYQRMTVDIDPNDSHCAINQFTLQYSSKALEKAYLLQQHDHMCLRSVFPAFQAVTLLLCDFLSNSGGSRLRITLGILLIMVSFMGSLLIKKVKERLVIRKMNVSKHDLYLGISFICQTILVVWVIGTGHSFDHSITCSADSSRWEMEVLSTTFALIIFMKPPFIVTAGIHLVVFLAITVYGITMSQLCIRNRVLLYFYMFSGLLFLYLAEYSSKKQFVRWIVTVDSLEAAKQEAEVANQAKRDFLSYIFHEIRVPLSAISIAVDLLSGHQKKEVDKAVDAPISEVKEVKGDTEEDESLVLMIRQQVDTVSHILDDVLSLQKIEEGKFVIEKSPFYISKMLAEVHWAYEKICSHKTMKIELEIAPELEGVEVIGDQYRLRQVLANFVSNALKFAPAVGGSVKIAAKEIRTSSGPMMEISVRDNGVGISVEDQQKLFRPYVQISAGELQKGRGTGLGLNISKHIIRLHEGSIGVRSLEKLGSKFFFQIPFVKSPSLKPMDSSGLDVDSPLMTLLSDLKEDVHRISAATPSQSSQSSTPSIPSSLSVEERFKQLRILVVEDNLANSKLLKRMLTNWGVTVSQAFNGLEAVATFAMCHPDEPPFELVLMDKEMPVMHGDEAIKQIRSLGHKMPIVVLSGNGFEEEKKNMMECGADAFLTKPTNADQLKETIQKFTMETPLESLLCSRQRTNTGNSLKST